MSVNSKMTAIADAIRDKTGGTAPLTLDQMAEEIQGIKTEPVLQELTVIENGVFTPAEGVDGFDKVTVEVEGSGGGLIVPKMAAVYFPIALSIPSNFGQIVVNFGSLIDHLNGRTTYTYSLVLYKNSVTQYTDLSNIANALSVVGRVGYQDGLSSFVFDYNSNVQARTSSGAMSGAFTLNVVTAFSSKSMVDGVASMTLNNTSPADFVGEWVGIFSAIAPFTSSEPINKLTVCPANFIAYEEVG